MLYIYNPYKDVWYGKFQRLPLLYFEISLVYSRQVSANSLNQTVYSSPVAPRFWVSFWGLMLVTYFSSSLHLYHAVCNNILFRVALYQRSLKIVAAVLPQHNIVGLWIKKLAHFMSVHQTQYLCMSSPSAPYQSCLVLFTDIHGV